MTKAEFQAVIDLMAVQPKSKACEAAYRVLVLNETKSQVAKDLGLSTGNVADACSRVTKTKSKLDAWCLNKG